MSQRAGLLKQVRLLRRMAALLAPILIDAANLGIMMLITLALACNREPIGVRRLELQRAHLLDVLRAARGLAWARASLGLHHDGHVEAMQQVDGVDVERVIVAEVGEVQECYRGLRQLAVARLDPRVAVSGEAREAAGAVGGAVGPEPDAASPHVVGVREEDVVLGGPRR